MKRHDFESLRPGTDVEFKNAVGIYRAKILAPRGRAGTRPGDYRVRILQGPDMIDWVVDLPASLITKTIRKRRR